MTTFRQDFIPEMLDSADWKDLIVSAIEEAPNKLHVTIGGTKLMSIRRVDLDGCTYPDGTPVWDAPLVGHGGVVTAYFHDGRVEKLTTEDGHTWETLIEWLESLVEGWDTLVAEMLSDLYGKDVEIREIEKRLAKAKEERIQIAKRGRLLGVSDYRMAQVVGRAKTTIAAWLK